MILAALLAMMASTSALKTPETSSLFEKFVDPESGAVSYLLKPGAIAHNQQSLYYTQKQMTDDGRFLVFVAEPSETEKDYYRRARLAVLDFLSDEVTVLDGFQGGTTLPYLDVREDVLLYLPLSKGVDGKGVYKVDLRGDMKKSVKLCGLPAALTSLGKIKSYYTHFTRTSDGHGVYLDMQLPKYPDLKGEAREIYTIHGVLDFTTGEFEEWYRHSYPVRHGAVNPVRPGVALALEPYWETHRAVHDCAKEGVCRRLLLIRKGKEAELIIGKVPPGGKPPVHVVHTEWTADGRGIYWCSYDNGVILHDIDSGEETVLMKENRAVHCEMSEDNRYIVFDASACERRFRGQSWKVGFYDRVTKRTSWIYTKSPELTTPDEPSKLHPDPHPNFAMNGRYAICTMNVKPGQLSVLVTPTAQFSAKEERAGK